MIFILGELFEFPDSVGSEIMEITSANFRVKLHRAKQQLYNFMDGNCGLINKANPCRCVKKTASYIKLGFVDPVNLNFQKDTIASVEKMLEKKVNTYTNQVLDDYKRIYQTHPYLEATEQLDLIRKLLSSDSLKDTFNIN